MDQSYWQQRQRQTVVYGDAVFYGTDNKPKVSHEDLVKAKGLLCLKCGSDKTVAVGIISFFGRFSGLDLHCRKCDTTWSINLADGQWLDGPDNYSDERLGRYPIYTLVVANDGPEIYLMEVRADASPRLVGHGIYKSVRSLPSEGPYYGGPGFAFKHVHDAMRREDYDRYESYTASFACLPRQITRATSSLWDNFCREVKEANKKRWDEEYKARIAMAVPGAQPVVAVLATNPWSDRREEYHAAIEALLKVAEGLMTPNENYRWKSWDDAINGAKASIVSELSPSPYELGPTRIYSPGKVKVAVFREFIAFAEKCKAAKSTEDYAWLTIKAPKVLLAEHWPEPAPTPATPAVTNAP